MCSSFRLSPFRPFLRESYTDHSEVVIVVRHKETLLGSLACKIELPVELAVRFHGESRQ